MALRVGIGSSIGPRELEVRGGFSECVLRPVDFGDVGAAVGDLGDLPHLVRLVGSRFGVAFVD